MSCTRTAIVNQALRWEGLNEFDGSHKKIIDVYNSHKPLARGYELKYTDAWCSGYASAVAIACSATDIIPTEVGCEKHINLFKSMGIWVENDDYIPKPGDYIFYYWDDDGNGDCVEPADHIGIVISVSGNDIVVIEGNYSNAVKRRYLEVNDRYIRGYGVPKYDVENSVETVEKPEAAADLEIGDVVNFTGSRHYISANTGTGYKCTPGKAKITAMKEGAAHPYHLEKVAGGGSTVYGWVDAADVAALEQEPEEGENAPDVEAMAMNAALTVIANAVIAGKFGNGEERKEKIYNVIQDKVNELLA